MTEPLLYIILSALTILVTVLLILVILLYSKFANLKAQQKCIEENFEGESLEDLFAKMFEKQDKLVEEITKNRKKILNLEEMQKFNYDKIGVVRYNATNEAGSKLSYSVGFSNDSGDGLIITGLHYSNGLNIYVKKVTEGISDIPLSKEEKVALERSKLNLL